jgi:hypothetical protein
MSWFGGALQCTPAVLLHAAACICHVLLPHLPHDPCTALPCCRPQASAATSTTGSRALAATSKALQTSLKHTQTRRQRQKRLAEHACAQRALAAAGRQQGCAGMRHTLASPVMPEAIHRWSSPIFGCGCVSASTAASVLKPGPGSILCPLVLSCHLGPRRLIHRLQVGKCGRCTHWQVP